METLIQDIRRAMRLLARSPAFTVVAVATLALGIGANTAIFSVVNSVLLQPLSYAQPDRLVRLGPKLPGGVGQSVSVPKFMAWKENTNAFEYVCVFDGFAVLPAAIGIYGMLSYLALRAQSADVQRIDPPIALGYE